MDTNSIAALFDLDGVVIDTEHQYTVLWTEIGNEHFPEIENFANKIKGMTLEQVLIKYQINQDVFEKMMPMIDAFESQMTYEYISGVETFLKELRGAGVKTAVVTSSKLSKMERVYKALPNLKSHFDHILTAELFANSKPAPDCYLLGAEVFHLPVSRCVVFEDSINGLKSGCAACMTVVGLTTTNPEEIVSTYSDMVIPNFEGFNFEKMQSLLSP